MWAKLSAVAEETQDSGPNSWQVNPFDSYLYENLVLTLKKDKMNYVWCSKCSECSAWGKLTKLAKVVFGSGGTDVWPLAYRFLYFPYPLNLPCTYNYLQIALLLKFRTISISLFHFWFLIASRSAKCLEEGSSLLAIYSRCLNTF